jgi:hypothetical protein
MRSPQRRGLLRGGEIRGRHGGWPRVRGRVGAIATRESHRDEEQEEGAKPHDEERVLWVAGECGQRFGLIRLVVASGLP